MNLNRQSVCCTQWFALSTQQEETDPPLLFKGQFDVTTGFLTVTSHWTGTSGTVGEEGKGPQANSAVLNLWVEQEAAQLVSPTASL